MRCTAEGWEFVALDFDDEEEVADYGTADWKGPPLEVVFTDIVISIKKRFLGEKESSCFTIGLIFDAEFDMGREPLVAQREDCLPTWPKADGPCISLSWLVTASPAMCLPASAWASLRL